MATDLRPEEQSRLEAEETRRGEEKITRALLRSLWLLLVALAVVAAILFLRRPSPALPPGDPPRVEAPPAPGPKTMALPRIPFTDITLAAGIDFIHENGAYGEKLLPETMGGGCGFLDFDGDGRQDIVLVNSTWWPGHEKPDGPAPTSRLYRNVDGTRFEDVTEAAGLSAGFYGMGVAAGDYDGDGDVDLYFTAVGPTRLLRNDSGRFVEVTETAGVDGGDADWSASAGFFDMDNDGDLDLFVCHYVEWSREIDLAVDYRLTGVGRAYGPPMNFAGVHSRLYRNKGDGTFEDVSAEAGIQVENAATGAPVGKALGVLPIDLDEDGFLDLIVANDTVQKFYFHNRGGGRFEENALLTGLAFDMNGNATGAMGIDGGRYGDEGKFGIFIGNFANEMTSLYAAQGDRSLFTDEAIIEGIGAASRSVLTFGLLLVDLDLDGRLDLVQANGHIEDEINIVQPSQHYRQSAQLFWNAGPKAEPRFVLADAADVGDLAQPIVGRGLAAADIDLDGDLDLLLTQVAGPPLLLRNDQSLGHHAIHLDLRSPHAPAGAIGATVEMRTPAGVVQRLVMPTRSYLSQTALPVVIGLENATKAANVRIRWLGASDWEELPPLDADHFYRVEQGKGVTSATPLN